MGKVLFTGTQREGGPQELKTAQAIFIAEEQCESWSFGSEQTKHSSLV